MRESFHSSADPEEGSRYVIATAGARSTPYTFAVSPSRMRFTSSIVILSESGGSSSRICRVCTHVSQSRVWVKNNRRTGRVMSANASRNFSWSDGEIKGIQRL
jgi:hypothetical protein